MVYYLIENKNGFEDLVFEGTEEAARFEKARLEANLDPAASDGSKPWLETKYYILPETDWTKSIGGIH